MRLGREGFNETAPAGSRRATIGSLTYKFRFGLVIVRCSSVWTGAPQALECVLPDLRFT